MRIEPLGDSACILRDLDRPAYEVAESIEMAKPPGVIEAVAAYESVGVYFDPAIFVEGSLADVPYATTGSASRDHRIPVCYEMGEDLLAVAAQLELEEEEVIRLHSETEYRCYAVGFCPGFPYLGYLPDVLAGVSRLPSPRVRTTPGSVAITGRQTGIYPLERPGGWPVIGKTPLTIVDVVENYFPIKAGDKVRFERIDPDQFKSLVGKRL